MEYKKDNETVLSEINVTPLVDVMLVLLIIFMVTAPLIQHGMDVNLPAAKAGQVDAPQDQFIVSITADKKIYILENAYSFVDFESKLASISKTKKNKKVYLRADKSLPYEVIIKVMATLKNNGFTEIGLVTDPQVQ